MPRKRVNKRKLGKKSQKKSQSGLFFKLLKLAAISIQFLILFLIIFACYAAIAFAINLFDGEHNGTAIHSEKIAVSSAHVNYVAGTRNSRSLPLHVYKTIISADKLLVLDFSEYPSFENGKRFYEILLSLQKQKPGLSIFLVANESERHFSDKCPAKFASLHQAGINVIFTDRAVPQTYRWLYSPLAHLISVFSPATLSFKLKNWINKTSKRNVIISHSDDGIKALTGSFSLLKNTGQLEMGLSISDAAALPLLKSELFLIREYMENETNGFAKGGREAINRDIETCLNNALDIQFPLSGNTAFQYLSEGEIKKRIISMLKNIENGDNVDIIAGMLNDGDVIKAIRYADVVGANVRVMLDKNTDEPLASPELPNILSAKKLADSSEQIQVRWLEGHKVQSSFIHIYNPATAKDQILLMTCPISTEYIGGFNLAGACYVEGEVKDSDKLIALFNTYSSNNATRSIYSKRFDKYPLPQSKLYFLKLKNIVEKMLSLQ